MFLSLFKEKETRATIGGLRSNPYSSDLRTEEDERRELSSYVVATVALQRRNTRNSPKGNSGRVFSLKENTIRYEWPFKGHDYV